MKVVPMFNMKGGVAKTTSSVLLAEGLAQFCGFRVLLADCDPQLNPTRMLLTSKGIEEAISGPQNRSRTVARYLLKSVNEANLPNPRDFVLSKVGTIHGTGQVDLLAGTPRTGDVADMMLVAGANPGRTLENILQRAAMSFRKLNEAGPYDVLLIDCPPGLTTIVRSALSAADLLIVPTTADDTAYAGIGNLVWHLKQRQEVKPAHTGHAVSSRARGQSGGSKARGCVHNLHRRERTAIRDARVFSPHAETTFKGKYGVPTEREFKKIISELTVMLGIARPNNVIQEPLPKDVIHVQGDQDSRELPNGTASDHGGKNPALAKRLALAISSHFRDEPIDLIGIFAASGREGLTRQLNRLNASDLKGIIKRQRIPCAALSQKRKPELVDAITAHVENKHAAHTGADLAAA